MENQMDNHLIISVLSKDRPGIIADITGTIYQLNGDLADLNQSVLFGYLTMILIATFDGQVTPDDIHTKIAALKSSTKLDVIVKKMEEPLDTCSAELPEKTYIFTAKARTVKDWCMASAPSVSDTTSISWIWRQPGPVRFTQ